jgi:NAD-dependent DNA ligase
LTDSARFLAYAVNHLKYTIEEAEEQLKMINIKNHKTVTTLATAALVAVIVVGIVTLGNEHFVSADNINKNDTVSVNLTCVITPKPGVSPCTSQ